MEHKKNILVIDDEEGIRKLLKDVLTSEGYAVTTASDGLEGIELAVKGSYDAVICDMKMPKASGFDVLDVVKKAGRNLKVILITGFHTDEELKLIREKGVFGFLPKPFTLDDVFEVVRKALNS